MSVRPNKQMLQRAIIVMTAVILCLTIVSSASLVRIMIVNGEEYQAKASQQQLYDSLITAPRGNIYDSSMNLLATSSPAWTIYLTPNGINKENDAKKAENIRTVIAKGLSEILEMEYDDIYALTQKNTYYVIVKKKVEQNTVDEIRQFILDNDELEIANYIGIDESTKRYYPNDTLASTVLGFVGDDNQGLAGLESYYDNELTGIAGRVVSAKNAKGTDMRFTYENVVEAQQGNSLVLTLDSYVQYVCEKYLDIAVEQEQIKERGAVVAMNVNTGAILGMAVSGDFNPNSPFTLSAEDQATVDAITDEEEKSAKRSELLNRQWRNKAVSDTYEPGSVFKIFTAAVALEEGFVTQNSTFTCNHTYIVAGNPYHCHDNKGGHGTQTLQQAMSNSCNPAFIQIGQLIGANTFSKYFKAFGLTKKTGIDLPGEASSYYHSEENMGPTELASSSFGQTFKITPIQMIGLAATAVNGGYSVKPHLVDKIIDSDNNVVESFSSEGRQQVISQTTSATMRTMLEYVVQNGAKNGIVSGYRVGGKTGTSQKVAEIEATGNSHLYIGSYVGVAPIDDPEIAVFVMLDEPTGANYYGGVISAPVGSKVMADILPYLGYEPQYTDEELAKISISVPDVVDEEIAAAKAKINNIGLSYKVIGAGEKVVSQLPQAGSSVYNNGTVILYTEQSESQTVTVPSLVGLTVSEVNNVAAASGINVEFSGSVTSSTVKSYNQDTQPGETVPIGQIVTVYFRDEASADMAEE
ncbi:MAG: penicillin-binding transpeptidase domain-containing protein [Acutalibacteraceae bacterium]|nr:penicillin-binding transpeptidase domain-containing protein [Acutalibacteraceae bacterium]